MVDSIDTVLHIDRATMVKTADDILLITMREREKEVRLDDADNSHSKYVV